MNYALFEDQAHFSLLPLTFTRPTFDLRIGIYSFKERWDHTLDNLSILSSHGYLQRLYDVKSPIREESIWINGRLTPHDDILKLLSEAQPGIFYINDLEDILLFWPSVELANRLTGKIITPSMLRENGLESIQVDIYPLTISTLTDLFVKISTFIAYDVEWYTAHEKVLPLRDTYTYVYGKDNVIVAPGAKVEAAVIHAEDGPVFIGPDTHIQPGAIVYGTHSLGEGVTVAMGAKLRGNTCIGPHAKVGGEVKNCYIGAYTNKGHEGYLGNSVLGTGCNLGADTNVSNMKNTLGNVKHWSYVAHSMKDTGMTFCGTVMGDYSRTGINTMLNTGTVVGVSAQIFGGGFPPKFIPSFTWGGVETKDTYRLADAIRTVEKLMGLKNYFLSDVEKEILRQVYLETAQYRTWEMKA